MRFLRYEKQDSFEFMFVRIFIIEEKCFEWKERKKIEGRKRKFVRECLQKREVEVLQDKVSKLGVGRDYFLRELSGARDRRTPRDCSLKQLDSSVPFLPGCGNRATVHRSPAYSLLSLLIQGPALFHRSTLFSFSVAHIPFFSHFSSK